MIINLDQEIERASTVDDLKSIIRRLVDTINVIEQNYDRKRVDIVLKGSGLTVKVDDQYWRAYLVPSADYSTVVWTFKPLGAHEPKQ